MCRHTGSSIRILLAFLAACSEPPAQADGAASRPSESRPAAPPPDYDAHVKKLAERLPNEAFAIVVEPPFVVIAEGGASVAKRWATGTVRWAVTKLKARYFERDPERILEIWLFDGDRSYRRYAREVFGDVPSTPFGYYSKAHGALIMNIATGGGTLVHEIVHPYVAANFAGCPAWLNEGLGSLYEQSAERDERIVGLTNWRLAGLQEAIRDKRTVPFTTLFATSDAEFYGARSGLHYAQARYLLYWLQEQGKLEEFWRSFRAQRETDPSGLATFEAVAGVKDMGKFQAEWEAFALGLKFE